jgi:histidine phosphotransferase ChpT
LVSPIGAISNGVEILEDEPDFARDAGKLIRESAGEASRRLQFYRIAYGSTEIPDNDRVRTVVRGLFGTGKIACEWSDDVPPVYRKLVCNLLLVAAEALPRGGRITLATGPSLLAIAANGPGARLAPPLPALLSENSRREELTPRTVQAAFTAALARRLDTRIELRQDQADEVSLTIAPERGA